MKEPRVVLLQVHREVRGCWPALFKKLFVERPDARVEVYAIAGEFAPVWVLCGAGGAGGAGGAVHYVAQTRGEEPSCYVARDGSEAARLYALGEAGAPRGLT